MVGMGIATLAARRILAIMIIGIVAAALCRRRRRPARRLQRLRRHPFVGGEIGAGLVVVVFGSLVALAGAIVACAKRRMGTRGTA